jgi:hypothetical protein
MNIDAFFSELAFWEKWAFLLRMIVRAFFS